MNKLLDLIPDNVRAFNPKPKKYIFNGEACDLNIIIQDLDLLKCSQENI